MAEYYCGIDLGSTAVKAALFDEKGRLCGEGVCEFLLETPRPEFVELDPELYWSSTCKAVKKALENANVPAEKVSWSWSIQRTARSGSRFLVLSVRRAIAIPCQKTSFSTGIYSCFPALCPT